MTASGFELLSDQEKAKNKLSMLLRDRSEVTLTDLCEKYKAAASPEVVEFLDILLSREDYAKNCTVILGETRESQGSPGTSLLEGSLDQDSQITPQAIVQDVRSEQEFINWKIVTTETDLKEKAPGELIDIAAHELAHTFSRYIISSYERQIEGDSSLVERLTPEEQSFYNAINSIHKNIFIPKIADRTDEKYLLKLDEFVARALTSSKDTIYGEHRDEVLDAFKKMYVNNTRKIISISKHLNELSIN
jgi:hypothetical protein